LRNVKLIGDIDVLTMNPCSIARKLYHPAVPKWFEP